MLSPAFVILNTEVFRRKYGNTFNDYCRHYRFCVGRGHRAQKLAHDCYTEHRGKI